MDTAPEALRGCFSPAVFWADAFWNGQLDRCSSQLHSILSNSKGAASDHCKQPGDASEVNDQSGEVYLKHRLNANTGVKAEGDAQLKLWVERIVAGLLHAHITA